MTDVVREQDVVITTAAVPGKRAPILITAEMVEAMAPGSVVVDLAAVRGGNCELTKPGETVHHHGVTIMGPANIPALAPYHSSQMFGDQRDHVSEAPGRHSCRSRRNRPTKSCATRW